MPLWCHMVFYATMIMFLVTFLMNKITSNVIPNYIGQPRCQLWRQSLLEKNPNNYNLKVPKSSRS